MAGGGLSSRYSSMCFGVRVNFVWRSRIGAILLRVQWAAAALAAVFRGVVCGKGDCTRLDPNDRPPGAAEALFGEWVRGYVRVTGQGSAFARDWCLLDGRLVSRVYGLGCSQCFHVAMTYMTVLWCDTTVTD